VAFCEHGEVLTDWEFLDHVSKYQLLKEYSVSWNESVGWLVSYLVTYLFG